MNKPLPKTVGPSFKAARAQIDTLTAPLFDRVDYIIRAICTQIKSGYIDYWNFAFTGDNDPAVLDGDAFVNKPNSFISFEAMPGIGRKNFSFKDKHGTEIDIRSRFPTRWLYESFEKELKDGVVIVAPTKSPFEKVRERLTKDEYQILVNHIKVHE